MLIFAEGGEFIARNAKHVKIHEEGLSRLVQEMFFSMKDNKLMIPETGANITYPSKDDPRAVDWVFICDALNFCFWAYSGGEKWTVEGQSGYYALEVALHRAIREGFDMTNPHVYSTVSPEKLRYILRSDNGVEIPLFEQRLYVLHEVGNVLLKKYNGTFKTCITQANKSVSNLLKTVTESFPCFRDEVLFRKQKVGIYKRAQILIADLWNFFEGKSWGEFEDIDRLTMFADYRVPQVLVYFGAMSYDIHLLEKLKKDELLPSGSNEEVEIRGCSIHCVELLKYKLRQMAPSVQVNSSLIDYYLWCYRRKHAEAVEMVPFHKTMGIYY